MVVLGHSIPQSLADVVNYLQGDFVMTGKADYVGGDSYIDGDYFVIVKLKDGARLDFGSENLMQLYKIAFHGVKAALDVE